MGRLFELYAEPLFRYALILIRRADDAEEILQRFFLRLIRNRNLLQSVRNIKAYLYKSLRNEALNFIRESREECTLPDHLLEVPSKAQERAQAAEIEEALGKLPQEQREIIVLKVYENLKFREIGELLEIPQDTAASRYRYALEKLRKALEVRHG
ncbi:MAG: RNA polymerase sigma factor [Armatimonadetes bacterium]|nr:RNA polymerase sigma factor [Armatimonadota bacterium]